MNMEKMSSNHKKLHIALFPWLAFGHMIPFLELSKCLAKKGYHISFVSTPRNLQRLPKVPQNLSDFIAFVPLTLPQLEGLPHNAEATSDVGYAMGYDLLKTAFDGLQEPMTKFLESSISSPHPVDWIIYDFACYWVPPIADKLGIRKVFFCLTAARFLAFLGPMSQDIDTNPGAIGLWSCPEILTSPPHWIPFPNSAVYLPPYEARSLYKAVTDKTSSGVSDFFRCQASNKGSDLIAMRSCMELEGEYLQLVERLAHKTVVPVGLLPPCVDKSHEDDDNDAWNSIVGWLEKQRAGSVVYVAFGSEFVPNQEQFTELALGLELSRIPFFLVFRTSGIYSSLELPEGFEERTRDLGMIYKSWVPQVRILSHGSVGGFLTHAGMNSIIETLALGKPLIMLPLGIDQGINAKFMEEKNVGIEIPRNKEDGSFTRNSVAKSLALVLHDEAGKTYKDHAKKISATIADTNLQNQYIDKFCCCLS